MCERSLLARTTVAYRPAPTASRNPRHRTGGTDRAGPYHQRGDSGTRGCGVVHLHLLVLFRTGGVEPDRARLDLLGPGQERRRCRAARGDVLQRPLSVGGGDRDVHGVRTVVAYR